MCLLSQVTQRVLVAWLGNKDSDAARGKGEGDGPIARVLGERSFDRVVVVDNHEPGWSAP
jgi:hypothetical protein